ncbi:MAG: M15 family metallopeptidase [Actinomycetota bacterium]
MRAILALALAVAVLCSPVVAAGGEDPFEGSVTRLDDETRALMTGSSWHEGCPVPLENLRLVRVTYRGFDEKAHRGRLVVHRGWADEILEVFRRLYRRGFPIHRVRLVDRYGADDRTSMRHDNTSAFNCRYIAGTTTWSQHAYGRAIDINPVENPYVVGTSVSPRKGRRFVDRDPVRRGMIVERDVVWRAFHEIGWEWGGTWSSSKDYQHFSANGH